MTASIIPFPATATARPVLLLPRPAEPGDRVMIRDECALATMIGESTDGRRAVLLQQGRIRHVDRGRIWPTTGPGGGTAA